MPYRVYFTSQENLIFSLKNAIVKIKVGIIAVIN